ncbi:hypothetical protein [Herbiconiux liukaitaii]|uniref:hypothetical protein n=1 Tax=Herbiconiux liukaitaii TaxID=3342799 RepID=UPI0035BA870A
MMLKETSRASKVTLWLSFGVLGAAVIAALIIFFLPTEKSTDAPDAAATASPAPASSTPTADAGGIGCKAPARDNRKVPTDLRWAASQGVTWPVSDSTGPTTTTAGFPACFEHSPTGAALAAVSSLYAQIDHSPRDVGEFYLAESPGRDAALADIGSSPSTLKNQLESNGLALVGFQVEQYDGDRAAIRIIIRVPNSSTGFRGLPYPMVWADGDWKIQPLDNGSTGEASDVTSSEFIGWTAVGNG